MASLLPRFFLLPSCSIMSFAASSSSSGPRPDEYYEGAAGGRVGVVVDNLDRLVESALADFTGLSSSNSESTDGILDPLPPPLVDTSTNHHQSTAAAAANEPTNDAAGEALPGQPANRTESWWSRRARNARWRRSREHPGIWAQLDEQILRLRYGDSMGGTGEGPPAFFLGDPSQPPGVFADRENHAENLLAGYEADDSSFFSEDDAVESTNAALDQPDMAAEEDQRPIRYGGGTTRYGGDPSQPPGVFADGENHPQMFSSESYGRPAGAATSSGDYIGIWGSNEFPSNPAVTGETAVEDVVRRDSVEFLLSSFGGPQATSGDSNPTELVRRESIAADVPQLHRADHDDTGQQVISPAVNAADQVRQPSPVVDDHRERTENFSFLGSTRREAVFEDGVGSYPPASEDGTIVTQQLSGMAGEMLFSADQSREMEGQAIRGEDRRTELRRRKTDHAEEQTRSEARTPRKPISFGGGLFWRLLFSAIDVSALCPSRLAWRRLWSCTRRRQDQRNVLSRRDRPRLASVLPEEQSCSPCVVGRVSSRDVDWCDLATLEAGSGGAGQPLPSRRARAFFGGAPLPEHERILGETGPRPSVNLLMDVGPSPPNLLMDVDPSPPGSSARWRLFSLNVRRDVAALETGEYVSLNPPAFRGAGHTRGLSGGDDNNKLSCLFRLVAWVFGHFASGEMGIRRVGGCLFLDCVFKVFGCRFLAVELEFPSSQVFEAPRPGASTSSDTHTPIPQEVLHSVPGATNRREEPEPETGEIPPSEVVHPTAGPGHHDAGWHPASGSLIRIAGVGTSSRLFAMFDKDLPDFLRLYASLKSVLLTYSLTEIEVSPDAPSPGVGRVVSPISPDVPRRPPQWLRENIVFYSQGELQPLIFFEAWFKRLPDVEEQPVQCEGRRRTVG